MNFVVGSEFMYQEHFLTNRSLVVAISQSGETADVIEPMLAAKQRGAQASPRWSTCADRRWIGSRTSRCISTPARSSASSRPRRTRAKVAYLLLTAHILNGSEHVGRDLLWQAVDGVRSVLTPYGYRRRAAVAERFNHTTSLFVIGRGLSYPTALEAALKIKEVSYIHAEGFAGGELKHGVIALIEQGTPCIVYSPLDETRRHPLRSDGAEGAWRLHHRHLAGIRRGLRRPSSDSGCRRRRATGDGPPAQMLGYQFALLRGNDPDKPRNLAKSVTVK